MPLISRPLKITCVQSIAVCAGGMPSNAILPPWFIASSMLVNALGTPDISSPTSKPSVMCNSRITSGNDSRDTFTARVVEAVIVDVGDHDIARTDVFGDRHRHDADRSGTCDQDVFADQIERQRRMSRVAERIEDGREIV